MHHTVASTPFKQPAFQLSAVRVRPVARHQSQQLYADLTVEEDISGRYEQLNTRTLYCEERSLFLELGPEAMARARAGQALRVASSCCS